jgi:nitrate reductase NapE
MQATDTVSNKWRELVTFIGLAVLIWPVIASAFVGAYGFSFWIYFIFTGPPGPR